MASSLTDLFTALQNGVTAINNLNDTLQAVFPQATALSTATHTGTITYTSSQAAAFLTVVTSSGGTYYVPLYT